jgi:hypothetical protein
MRVTTAEGVTCTSGDSGVFLCDDGTVLSFAPNALSPPGIAAATTEGLWSPRATTGEAVTVAAAVRG